MTTKKSKPDSGSLTPEDMAEIERTMPSGRREAETQFLKMTQNGARPTWIRIFRRRGLLNLIDGVMHQVDPPYRWGEPALVTETPQSIQLGDGEQACWRLKYGDKINEAYPQEVVLPIMEYVWVMVPSDQVGMSYVLRKDKSRDAGVPR